MVFPNFAHTSLCNMAFMRQASMFPKSVNFNTLVQPIGLVKGAPDTLVVMVEKDHLRDTLNRPGIREMLEHDLSRWGQKAQLKFVAPAGAPTAMPVTSLRRNWNEDASKARILS